jgi:hypothetical protein
MSNQETPGSIEPRPDTPSPDQPRKPLRLILLGLLIVLLLAGMLILGKVIGKGQQVEPLPGVSNITGFTGQNARLFLRGDDPQLVFNGKQLKPGQQKIFIAKLKSQGQEGTYLNLPAPGSGYAFVYFPSRGWLASFSNDTAPYLSEKNPGSVITVLSDRGGRALRFEGLDELSAESSFTYVAEPSPQEVPSPGAASGGQAG